MLPAAKRLDVRARARADLAEIFQYTASEWDIDQARRYARDLDSVMLAIVAGTVMGKLTWRRGLYVVPARSHRIYFRRRGSMIIIVRVLHPAMNAQHRLG